MKCGSSTGCPGEIIITNTDRDGERAHCQRCHRCVTYAELLNKIDSIESGLTELESIVKTARNIIEISNA